ncbi:MAG: hypothetical protein C4K49_03260 [Candidatus Thorarchaeota archaeon]|nr:MAG: hypothetical protein C4K49_03260 [Candidatus Thorarchaeota archaeon]
MAFDFSAIQRQMEELNQKLKAIESFASRVAETKKLADQLAENFAGMKTALNQAMNQSFSEIADQIENLRRNMESMEKVQASPGVAPITIPAPTPSPAPASRAAPTPGSKSAPTPAPKSAPTAAPAAKTATAPAPAPAPRMAPTPAPAPAPASAGGGSDQIDVLLQQKDRLKASLTDLRFDYMRGYIPEDEYKTKEADLDSQLEDLDRQIAGLK